MKRIIKELTKSSNDKDLIIFKANIINELSKEKQDELIKKLREIDRKQKEKLNKMLLKFNWL